VTVAVAAGVVLLSFVGYTLLSRRMLAEMDRSLIMEATSYQTALDKAPDRSAPDVSGATRSYLSTRTGAGANTIILVRLPDGKILTNTDVPLERAPANQASLDPARTARSFASLSLGTQRYRVATVPLVGGDGRVVAVFQAALPTTLIQEIATDHMRTLLVVGLLIILVGAALSHLVARASLRPLHDAARTAGTITQSTLSARVKYDGPPDDVGLLVSSLNDMLDRLETAFGEQRRFVADASHELRTPLTVIRGHLDVMRDAGGLTDDQEESLELVSSELRRMTALVTDLLALARLEAGPPRVFQVLDLSEVIEDAVVMAHALGDRRISLELNEGLWLRGDRDLLLQALLVLMSNAVNHTQRQGSITVKATPAHGRVFVSIADDGPGIPPGHEERIFDRFYRSPGNQRPTAGGGSGLGLTIARRLIGLHGGRLTAHNDPQGGAVFSFALSVVPPPLDQGAPGGGQEMLMSV
jgi:two-component system OmpR family sensor kinase